MPDTTRTFLALTVPESVSSRLARLQTTLAHDARQGRWSTPMPWHLTLAFLGDVPHTDLAEVCRVTRDVSAQCPRFRLNLRGAGAFPTPVRPSVVWAGVSGTDVPKLLELQTALAAALGTLGFPRDRRAYHPHVTLGRLTPGRQTVSDMTALLGQFSGWASPAFSVDSVTVFASNRTADGPEYSAMSHAPLATRKA